MGLEGVAQSVKQVFKDFHKIFTSPKIKQTKMADVEAAAPVADLKIEDKEEAPAAEGDAPAAEGDPPAAEGDAAPAEEAATEAAPAEEAASEEAAPAETPAAK